MSILILIKIEFNITLVFIGRLGTILCQNAAMVCIYLHANSQPNPSTRCRVMIKIRFYNKLLFFYVLDISYFFLLFQCFLLYLNVILSVMYGLVVYG